MANVLECRNVEKLYGSKTNVTCALKDVSLSVRCGEFVGIMGASGSGKTTLLNCISTIDTVTAGSILVDGGDITRLKQRDVAAFRRDRLGFVFQDSNLLDTLTAFENIALALTIKGTAPRMITSMVRESALALGITDVLEKYPYQMSGGQKQRVAAARALVTKPSLILADEPTGALDSKNAKTLLESFENLNQTQSATILMVTHDSFAASYCHRILFLRDGQIFQELVRGDKSRKQFFGQIIDVVSFLGGESADVR